MPHENENRRNLSHHGDKEASNFAMRGVHDPHSVGGPECPPGILGKPISSQIALQTNNPDALESYLQQYPDTAKRSEILSKIDNLRRAEFTEWTLFEMSAQKYPQFMKLSSKTGKQNTVVT